ncbi:MAG: phytanoyl-CoA dioxygenase family protein [Pseudomonadota bacterium]
MELLRALIEQDTRKETAPHAAQVANGVPIYDCAALGSVWEDAAKHTALKAELADVLLNGPGVFALKAAYKDTEPVDAATSAFETIIAQEKSGTAGGGDHFAAAGSNDRIWNSLEKLALTDPKTFVAYHANPWLKLAAESWLGPAFQMTAQVNLVYPGGQAQEGHCDYHLGFMTAEQTASYPAHVHAMSAQLTLQGAIAHCDMPLESGPTKLLPHSQKWAQNYLQFRDPSVRALFEEHHIQMPLEKGDMLFFSPGLLHAAGANTSRDINRMANLVQISSAFGRAMETVDRTAICKAIFPHLATANMSHEERESVIASSAEGYPFPTNLDRDPPVNGLAPPSQQDMLRVALEEGWNADSFSMALDSANDKRTGAVQRSRS